MPTRIYSLPPELLLAIFEYTVSPSAVDSQTSPRSESESTVSSAEVWPDVFDVNHGPWVLGQVCSKWRSISLSLPYLWSAFYLRLPQHEENAVDVLRAWLDRSGNTPLQFQITATAAFCGQQSLLTVLAAASHRWQSVALVDVSMGFLDALATQREIQNSSFPLLQELSFLSRNSESDFDISVVEDSPTALEIFLNAPKLNTLVNLDSASPSTFQFPWNQLTTYVGSEASHTIDHLEVMLLCPNLVECDVAFREFRNWPAVSSLPLLKLKKWTIRTCSATTDVYALLSRTDIQVPQLKELSLLAGPYSLDPALNLLYPALCSSRSQLEYLELSGKTESESFSRFLEISGTITHIRIWMDSVAILPPKNLLPMLNTLELGLTEQKDIYELDMTALADVVRFRLESDCVQSIQKLNIVVGERETSIVRPPIMEVLEEEGLLIQVCSK
ncbi:hypothetical protein BDP27DRAFT_1418801 [Rhodocollybia butyracea]|uniref:F-box domain-containing protein n=1 Tax=Rhodocollybia butyracea TaxID=206335 RepID=A0A9P5PYP1_9AGAR|nr:hypothetical protein BDP27DRAFT_1418801 [Rhodocollybia butyracea]